MGRSSRRRKLRRHLLLSKAQNPPESGPETASARCNPVATPAAECSSAERKNSLQDLGPDESNLVAIKNIMGELHRGEFRYFLSLMSNICAVARHLIDHGPPELYRKAQEFTKEDPGLLGYIMEGPHMTIIPSDAPFLQRKDLPSAREVAKEPVAGPVTPIVASHQHQHNVASGLQLDSQSSQAGHLHKDGPGNQQRSSGNYNTTALAEPEISHAQEPSTVVSFPFTQSASNGPSAGPCSQLLQGYTALPQPTTTPQLPPMSHAMQPEASYLNGPLHGDPSSITYNSPAQTYAGAMWAGHALPSPANQMLQFGQCPPPDHSVGLVRPLVSPHSMAPAQSEPWNQGLSAQTAQYPI